MQEQGPFLFYLASTQLLIHFSPCLTCFSLKNSFISNLKKVVLVQPLCRNSSEHSGWKVVQASAIVWQVVYTGTWSEALSSIEVMVSTWPIRCTLSYAVLQKMEKLANQQWVEIGWGMQGHWQDWLQITSSYFPWIRKIPWRRKWQHTAVLLPGKSHGWRSLAGYSPRGSKESDTTEATSLSLFVYFSPRLWVVLHF